MYIVFFFYFVEVFDYFTILLGGFIIKLCKVDECDYLLFAHHLVFLRILNTLIPLKTFLRVEAISFNIYFSLIVQLYVMCVLV